MARWHKRLKREKTFNDDWGTLARNTIHAVTTAIHPYTRYILPNFLAVHYFYIVTMSILGSIVLYPVRNMRYIDALFFATGSATQSGLNTIDINKLKLYQQITFYIITMLTTPIVIHGSLLLVRLYYFERHFDDVKEKSKLDFKMRRSATLMARTQSQGTDIARMNAASNTGIEPYSPTLPALGRGPGATYGPDNGKSVGSGVGSGVAWARDYDDDEKYATPGSTPTTAIDLQRSGEGGDVGGVGSSEGSGEGSSQRSDPLARPNNSPNGYGGTPADPRGASPNSAEQGIRFGDLPRPSDMEPAKRHGEVEPSDMYKSIAMLSHGRHNPSAQVGPHTDNGESDDDVLIIKLPNEIEKDENNPIYRKKAQIQFNIAKPAKPPRHRGKQWTKLRKTLSGGPMSRRRHRMNASLGNESRDSDRGDDDHGDDDHGDDDDNPVDSETDSAADADDDASIDSENSHLDNESAVEFSDDVRLRATNASDNASDNFPSGSASGAGVRPRYRGPRRRHRVLSRLRSSGFAKLFSNSRTLDTEDDTSLRKYMSTGYLSWVPTVGRNSAFIHMTEEQKSELGGVEYRAVKLLIKIIIAYYIGFHIVALVMLLPWILAKKNYSSLLRADGVSPTWWAFFTAASSFNDLGFTLTPDSMMSFTSAIYTLMVMSFFIVIGNTGFPVLLRFIIWILFICSKPLSLFKESLGFLLDHPRRCFTLLFPSVPSWWLFTILIVLNGVDWILYIILDYHSQYLSDVPRGYRVMDGLFQAFCTRTAGFSVVNLSKLHAAVQVSYMIMMYISVLPLAISIRRTNVYEEQSLGVYVHNDGNQDHQAASNGGVSHLMDGGLSNAADHVQKLAQQGGPHAAKRGSAASASGSAPQDNDDIDSSPTNFIGTHLRNQLSFDLWFIFLALFIVCIVEGGRLSKGEPDFSIFSILFEIVSAYGTVGMSLGYPTINASLSGEFRTISKLVIIAVMVRGRHRGLPYAIDRAVMLPSDLMKKKDDVQQLHAKRRTATVDSGRASTREDGNMLQRAISRGLNNRRQSFWSLGRVNSTAPRIDELMDV